MDRIVSNQTGLVLLGVVCFAATILITPVLRLWFRRIGLVDHPDGTRKLHTSPIPRVGGVAIAFAFLLAGLLIAAFKPPWFQSRYPISEIGAAVVPVMVIFSMGLVDDLYGTPAHMKLVVQVIAAVLSWFHGIALHFPLPLKSIPGLEFVLTVFWLALCTNAFNLVDGMDGLAGGLGLIGSLAVACFGIYSGNISLVITMIPLMAGLLAFLFYNFPPASVFLGNSGSYTIGFLLGMCAIVWSNQSSTLLPMTAPAIAFALPILDVGLAVFRRFLRMKPILGPDRFHIHHKLLEHNPSSKQVALVLYGLAALCSALAVVLSACLLPSGLIIALFVLLMFAVVHTLRYEEIHVLASMLRQGKFRKALATEIKFHSATHRMMSAKDGNSQWEALKIASRDFGFCSVRLVAPFGSREHRNPDIALTYDCRRVPCDECRNCCAVSVPVENESNIVFYIHGHPECADVGTIGRLSMLVRHTIPLKAAGTKPAVVPSLLHEL